MLFVRFPVMTPLKDPKTPGVQKEGYCLWETMGEARSSSTPVVQADQLNGSWPFLISRKDL